MRDLAFFILACCGCLVGGYGVGVKSCERELKAATLTLQGSTLMLESCVELDERLEVCELGMDAAEIFIEECKETQ